MPLAQWAAMEMPLAQWAAGDATSPVGCYEGSSDRESDITTQNINSRTHTCKSYWTRIPKQAHTKESTGQHTKNMHAQG
jgi:hypothetical protein